jgi:hypothetical protein
LWTVRRATIRSVLKVVYFLRTKKRARFGVYFSISIHQGIKIVLRHFRTSLVPSLTLQISVFVQSSLESPTLECLAYHLIAMFEISMFGTWEREVNLFTVSDGTRVVGLDLDE